MRRIPAWMATAPRLGVSGVGNLYRLVILSDFADDRSSRVSGRQRALERGGSTSGANAPDAELIRAMQAGDDAGFEALFQRYQAPLQALCYRQMPRRLQRRVSVADVLQEARWTAYQQRHTFEDRGPNSFRNWLFKIAELKGKELVRRHAGTAKRDVGREVTRGERAQTDQFPQCAPSPSQVAICGETRALAESALEGLPASHREILRLTRDKRRSLREVAELTGRSYEATRKLMTRALARFTAEFERLQRREP